MAICERILPFPPPPNSPLCGSRPKFTPSPYQQVRRIETCSYNLRSDKIHFEAWRNIGVNILETETKLEKLSASLWHQDQLIACEKFQQVLGFKTKNRKAKRKEGKKLDRARFTPTIVSTLDQARPSIWTLLMTAPRVRTQEKTLDSRQSAHLTDWPGLFARIYQCKREQNLPGSLLLFRAGQLRDTGGSQNGGIVISSGSVPGHSEAVYTVHTVQYTGSGFRRYAEWRNGYQFWLRARA
ncbi:hypothetical protein RRG08_026799 [Elysia crispata]|uniref:Uncharacterized protein n=1 Tax=Elysia crispata TaxID=231223 RepID=A0AAE1E2T7_9GAST|nr:hypothetical protein RRG08_026799 [Elysia crispata]